MSDQAKAVLDLIEGFDEGGGGRGVYCEARIEMVIKSFATGLTPETSMRAFEAGNAESEKQAVEAVTNAVKAAGLDPTNNSYRPTKCINFHCFADSVIGSTWQGDRPSLLVHYGRFWRGYQEEVEKDGKKEKISHDGVAKVLLTEAAKAGLFTGFGKRYFVHMHVAVDPSRKVAEGERPKTVWYADTFYKTREELVKAAEEAGAGQPVTSATTGGPVPEGWPPDVWAQTVPQIKAAVGKDKTPPNVAKVAAQWGVTPEIVRSLL